MEDHPPRRFFARNFIHLVQMEIDNFIKEDPRKNFIPHLDTFFLFSVLGPEPNRNIERKRSMEEITKESGKLPRGK